MQSMMALVAGGAVRQPTLDRRHVLFVHNGFHSRFNAHVSLYRKYRFSHKYCADGRYRRATDQTTSRKRGFAVATFCNAATEWNLKRVAGDGRCLFRALVQGEMLSEGRDAMCVLSLEEEVVKADELRSRVCDELLLRREDVEPFLESRIEEYVRCMRMERTWGGEPELAMAAHVLQRKVVVYRLKSGFEGPSVLEKISEYEPSVIQRTKLHPLSPSCDEQASESVESPGKRPINLLYSGSCHYDALVLPSTL